MKYKQWNTEFLKFKGDKALFWAGKMSIVINMLNFAKIEKISETMELLNYCRSEYDNIIIGRS